MSAAAAGLGAMALANARFWPTVMPRVRRGLRFWEGAARRIPDDRLRQIAVEKLAEERFNTEVAATLATLTPRRHRGAAVDAIVPLQVMYDYLDGVTEEPAEDPLANGRQLFAAFRDSLGPVGRGRPDYYSHSTRQEDDGYLNALAAACRGAFGRLPMAAAVAPAGREAALRCGEAQTRTHALGALGVGQLAGWASAAASTTDLSWWEYTAGGTASILSVHALIAAAADPGFTAGEARRLDRAYLYVAAISTLLDSLVDREADLAAQGHSFIGYYPDDEAAAAGIGKVIARAAAEAGAARNGAHHRMTAAGVAGYYLSSPAAASAPGPAIERRAREELGPLLPAALGVFRLWRLGKRLGCALLALVLAAALQVGAAAPAQARPSQEPFGIVPGSLAAAFSSGQAGGHADLSLALEFAHDEEGRTHGDLRSAVVDLPAGLVANPAAVPACTQVEFLTGDVTPACAPASQVGSVGFVGHLATSTLSARLPLYRLAPSQPGLPAQLGFRFASFVQLLPVQLRADGGLTVSALDVPILVEPREVSIEIWGVPAEASHDAERGRWCSALGGELSCTGGGQPAGVAPRPFLANPTGCGAATATVRALSWEGPEAWLTESDDAGPVIGCERVPFSPSLRVAVPVRAAETPSGLAVSLATPTNWTDPEAISSSALRGAKALLPEGFTLNPAYAAGLEEGSVIGTLSARTPLLREPVSGKLYLGRPLVEEGGVHVPLHAVAEAPEAGVRLELEASLDVDARSGRTMVAIGDLPQLPVGWLELAIGAGRTGPFVTPELCGGFEVRTTLLPWAAPGEPRLLSERIVIDRGASGPCLPAADQPFRPELLAASTRPLAGAHSPFRVGVTREDGEARLAGVSFQLPPGLGLSLAGTGVCSDAALAAAGRRAAAVEAADPSCPEGALLGGALVEVGAGAAPAKLRGRAYLAEPFGGARRSLALVTPALLGPFDLGTAVVRLALRVDPRTGVAVVGSGEEPLPSSLGGIPLRLRGVTVELGQPGVVRNPTRCQASATIGIVHGVGADGQTRSALASLPYRVEGCRRLRFAPSLRLELLGAARNRHPGVRVVFVSHPDEANLAAASVSMPPGLLLDPASLGTRSTLGWARARSPLLGEPLRGRVHLRPRPGARLPDLVAELGNQEADLRLALRLRMGPDGVDVVTGAVPDLPVSELVLFLAGGRRGLLVSSRDVCGRAIRVRVRMVGHNGRARRMRARMATRCPARPGSEEPRASR